MPALCGANDALYDCAPCGGFYVDVSHGCVHGDGFALCGDGAYCVLGASCAYAADAACSYASRACCVLLVGACSAYVWRGRDRQRAF